MSFQTYYNSWSATIDAVGRFATYKGYTLDADEYANTFIDAFLKPKVGQTRSESLAVFKNGKSQKARLQIQIYRMDNGVYEFNAYVL